MNKAKAFPQHKSGVMNSLEKSYSLRLEALKLTGEIKWYIFESVNLRIGVKCHYRVDFMVQNSDDVIEFHEVKGGYWRDDARVKIKAVADKFPFIFRGFTFKNKKWIEEDFTIR